MSDKRLKCPMYNQGICEAKIIPMCKFNDKRCFVNPLVYSLFLKEKREKKGFELGSIKVRDCKKCIHNRGINSDYFGSCEGCFRQADLSDYYTEEG